MKSVEKWVRKKNFTLEAIFLHTLQSKTVKPPATRSGYLVLAMIIDFPVWGLP